MKRGLLIALGAALASFGFGQALITSGGSSFGWSSPTDANISGASIRTGTGGGGSVTFTASGSPDELFQQWWWFRVNGVDTREFALSSLTSKTVTGNNMVLRYSEADGFDADVTYTLTNQVSGALLTATVLITNTAAAPIDMSFFDYFDFDLNTSGSDDTATLVSDNPAMRMLIGDAGGPQSAEFRAIDGSAYQVGAYSTVRTLLTDTSVNNLNNTGLPFGPADFTAANQWDFSLGVRESIMVQTSFRLTPVPEPATMFGVFSGIGLLIARRRRRA